ncbi:MAG: hypothetical protein ACOYOB_18875, partial [Myxococcota bacterium]
LRFSRPIRWLVCKLDDVTVGGAFYGLPIGDLSQGHRVLGALVVIDHKSTPVGSAGGQVAVARRYAVQLQAYEQALAGLGRRVAATWIHFPMGGACARVDLPSR